MNRVQGKFTRHFIEIQKTHWRKSLFLFVVLFVFYYILLGIVALAALFGMGLLIPGVALPGGHGWTTFLTGVGLLAVAVAGIHFLDARRHGARFIQKRLQAAPPDPDDRYHRQFINTVEEMRLAAGIPRVEPFVIPAFAVNSMALIAPDGTPGVLVTEGLLAEFTRDELEAVVAHELAHVIRGDTFFITLVCSLADVFERLRRVSEPERSAPAKPGKTTDAGGGHPLLWLASSLSALIMYMLSTLISRQRELLADGAAVELSRTPDALARAIYKAHVKNSFVGDFYLSYSPLFIVPPESRGEEDGLLGRIFATHPPLSQRIRALADMIPKAPSQIIQEVWEARKRRGESRVTVRSQEEKSEPSRDKSGGGTAREEETRPWTVHSPGRKWEGPFSISEILGLRYFTPGLRMRNEQEGIEAPAREFPQIRNALRGQYLKRPIDPSRRGRCPRCRVPLIEAYYEGVPILSCPDCGGKLVDSHLIDRIIARREVAFSDRLRERAEDFRARYMNNPFRTRKLTMEQPPTAVCPGCGTRMLPRPYTYQYIVPVDKCLACYKTWFDADELEILQILIEDR